VRIRGVIWDITERKAGELALFRSNRALRTLSACNAALVDAVSEPELLDTVCRLIVDAGGYTMAWVGFAEQSPEKLVRVVAQYGSTKDYLESMHMTWTDAEQGRGPTGVAIRTGTTQVHQSLMDDSDKSPWRVAALAQGFQSSVALPLKGPSGTLGALTLYGRERDAFTKDEVHLLEELAGDLTFGIETLRTRVERDRMSEAQLQHAEILRKSLEDSIRAIADTVEMRDAYTAGHQRRVAQLAVSIAGDLGLSKDEIHGIHLAAGIHDLGKIRVPAEILSKPGKLTNIEFMLIKEHSQAGYDILKGIEFPWPIATMVLQHHERLDGSGYPQGLKGEQILLGARIIAVADVVEAMASHRPYRAALGTDLALAEIERGRGTVYDPAVGNACLKLFREGRFAFQ
jgi:response regulator RpfG family c-di-GMP phosphodiesterase